MKIQLFKKLIFILFYLETKYIVLLLFQRKSGTGLITIVILKLYTEQTAP